MRAVSAKPTPEARLTARSLGLGLCEVEIGTANLFGHADIAQLVGPVDEVAGDDSRLIVTHDALQRLVQTLVASTQTLLLLATWAAGQELGTEKLTPKVLARRRALIISTFDAADDF